MYVYSAAHKHRAGFALIIGWWSGADVGVQISHHEEFTAYANMSGLRRTVMYRRLMLLWCLINKFDFAFFNVRSIGEVGY